jgi:protein-S-isoprenylcysteine O-methyltransferase Ste14
MSGLIAAIFAVCLDIWALKTLIESDTTVMPHRPAKHLVTRGPFGFTRNPSYVAYTIITASIGLLTGSAWFFVAAGFAAVTTNFVAIHQEERHLLARFGCEFEYYCKHTRRWL